MKKKILAGLIIILGLISGGMFFVAGKALENTGGEMQFLISQSGTSLAEAYYQNVGDISTGLGKGFSAFGMAIITLSVGMASMVIVYDNNKKENDIKENDCIILENNESN